MKNMFVPLKSKIGIKVFFKSLILIAITYLIFSILLVFFFSGLLPNANLLDKLLFSALKAFAPLMMVDWIILSLFPLIGGLLFANYNYYKCKTEKKTKAGLFVGFLAASCPACVLPLFGMYSMVIFLSKISLYIEIGALILLLVATYYVANRKKVCDINISE